MNGGILYGDWIWRSELQSSGASTRIFDVERTMDEAPSIVCTGDTTSGVHEYIIYDLQTARSPSAWAVINHNIASTGCSRIQLKVGSTDDGSTFDVVQAEFRMSDPALHANACGLVPSISKRYWCVKIYPDAVGEYFLGCVALGTWYEFDRAPAAPLPTNWYDGVSVPLKMGDRTFSVDQGTIYPTIGVGWPTAPVALKNALDTAYDVQGGPLHPICFVNHDADDDPSSGGWECYYATMENYIPKQVVGDSRWSVSLSLEGAT